MVDEISRVFEKLQSEFGKELDSIQNPSVEAAEKILKANSKLRKVARLMLKTKKLAEEIEDVFDEKNPYKIKKETKKQVERINSEVSINEYRY